MNFDLSQVLLFITNLFAYRRLKREADLRADLEKRSLVEVLYMDAEQKAIAVPAKHKQLNGWKRLGIVASVLWSLGAFVWVASTPSTHWRLFELCMAQEAHPGYRRDLDDCRADYSRGRDAAFNDVLLRSTFVALVPLPLSWLFAWLAIWLVRLARGVGRWVKRGFEVQQ